MKPSTRVLIPTLTALVMSSLPCAAQCLEWDARFFTRGIDHPAFSENVYALTEFDDGSGPAVYVGGTFTRAGNVAVSNVAKWDGSSWSALGGGLGLINQSVLAFGVFDDGSGAALYAGGSFAGGIAKWNGSSWTLVGTGTNSVVNVLTVFDDGTGAALYAGGSFTLAGGTSADRIAKWDGASWSAVGGGMDHYVNALAVFDDGTGAALYAGGGFQMAGGIPALRIAQWNGSSWKDLDSGMDSDVHALAVFDDGVQPALYVGGGFTLAGATPANRIAKWDGVSPWTALGTGANAQVFALSVFDDGSGDALYLGGTFTAVGGASASRVATWDGVGFSAVGGGCDQGVFALQPFDDGSGGVLVAGGSFLTAEGEFGGRLARWDGDAWDSLDHDGAAVNGPVRALARFDDGTGGALYAGGEFLNAGDVRADYIAQWDGAEWTAVGPGIGGTSPSVRSLATYDDGTGTALYAGGKFTSAGFVGANNVARWDGASWSALGTGITGGAAPIVNAQVVYDDGTGPALYVTGSFTLAGGVGAAHIAKWNGTSWSPLGAGLAGGGPTAGNALVVFDDGAGPELFVAGIFTSADGVGVNRIAKWNGTSFAPAGGFNTTVNALAVFDDGSGEALYAGGLFTMASGMSANRIAKRVGTSWQALGTGMDNTVLTLLAFHEGTATSLFAGGSFTTAGGVSAGYVARWNGTGWSGLDDGTNNWVYALAEFDDGADGAADLYLGGGFTNAGGSSSNGIAQWHGCEPGVAYCFGDGLDPVVTADCPCSNFGDPARGCGNSAFASGGRLNASGATNPNTILFKLIDVPNNTLATGLSNTANAIPGGVVFGDGVRCQTGALVRFGSHNTGTLGDAPNTWTAPAFPIAPGLTRYYQIQYRNSAPAFCPPATFNVSNGYSIVW